MSTDNLLPDKISKSLDDIKKLLQQSLAIQLYKGGATQDEIAKNLKITKATINQMVKGINKEKGK
jgi:DNA-binding transcriptional regulator LsrR (DeoR family)